MSGGPSYKLASYNGQNLSAIWRCAKFVTILTQSCPLDYHLLTLAERLVIFVHYVYVLQCYVYCVTVMAMYKNNPEMPDSRHFRITHYPC